MTVHSRITKKIEELERKELDHRIVNYVMFFLFGFVVGIWISGGF